MTLPDPVLVLPRAWIDRGVMQLPQGIKAHVYEHTFGLRVLVTHENRGPKAGTWLHVSLSRPDKLPSWADVREVKDLSWCRRRCPT